MRAPGFIAVTLVCCAVFALVRHLDPYLTLSIAGWAISGWIAMVLVAAVGGLLHG